MDEFVEKMVAESVDKLSLPAISRILAVMQERVQVLAEDGYKKCQVKDKTWKVLSALGELVSTLSVLPPEYTSWFNERCPSDMPELETLLLTFKDTWDNLEEVKQHECHTHGQCRRY